MSWAGIRCVAFDFGGTLTAPGWRTRADAALVASVLADQYGWHGGAEFTHAYAEAFERARESNRSGGSHLPYPAVLADAAGQAGVELPDTPEALATRIEEALPDSPVDADAATTVRELHGRGYRLVLSANTQHNQSKRRATLHEAGIADCFATLVCSADVGCGKPDPAFYAHVLAAGHPAPQVLHVGDRLVNDVIGPRRHGMRAALVAAARPRDRRPGEPVLTRVADLADLLPSLPGL